MSKVHEADFSGCWVRKDEKTGREQIEANWPLLQSTG